MIVAESDKEWLKQPITILVLETVLSHLKFDICFGSSRKLYILLFQLYRDTT